MKIKHVLACSLSLTIFILTACSGSNAARTPVNIDVYGILQPGIVVDTISYKVESLQNYLTPFPLGNNNGTGICKTITPGSTGNQLCQSNINATALLAGMNFPGIMSFVKNNTAGVTSTRFYRIVYTTPSPPYTFAGGATQIQNVSALIIMPQDANGNSLTADRIKGVILYYHPTISSKSGIPSSFDASNPKDLDNTLYTDLMLAAIYASQGYAVIAPDYVGQGVNFGVQHPYAVYAVTNAQSGIYALKAARSATRVNTNIVLPNPANLYITSYSEGGSYALWTSKLVTQSMYGSILTTNGFNLRRTAGISGAYDLSGATSQYMADNVDNSWNPELNIWNVSPGFFQATPQYPILRSLSYINLAGGKALFAPYLLTALTYYASTQAAFGVVVFPQFSQMRQCVGFIKYIMTETTTPAQNTIPCSAMTNNQQLNLPQLFNTVGVDTDQIFNQSFGAALTTGYMFGFNSPTFKQLVANMQTAASSNNNTGGGNNTVDYFIAKNVATDPTVRPYLQAQDIAGGWSATSPLELIYLRYDSLVPNVNSLEACGLSSRMTNGVRALSSAGMVNCTQVDNASSEPGLGLYQQFGSAPLFLDHAWAEPTLQMVALSKFLANP